MSQMSRSSLGSPQAVITSIVAPWSPWSVGTGSQASDAANPPTPEDRMHSQRETKSRSRHRNDADKESIRCATSGNHQFPGGEAAF